MNEIAEKETAGKPQETESDKALYEASRDSVVNVYAKHFHNGKQVMGSAGSGFFVSSDKGGLPTCEIATDNHVIHISDDLKVEFEITLEDGSKHSAKVLKQDPAHDLAFLKVEGLDPSKQCKPLPLADKELEPGESALRLSRTRWESEYKTGTLQRVESRSKQELPELAGEDKNRDLLVFNTENNIGHQYSGGPYLNKDGRVVAIHEGGQASDISLATPLQDLKAQLEQLQKGN